MLNGAIFDMDGTLLDSMRVWDTLGADYLRKKGVPPFPGLREALKPLTMQEAATFLRERCGIAGTNQALIGELSGILADFYLHTLVLKPGAAAFLRRLRAAGTRLCIATATDRALAEAALARCGVLELFDFILTCSEAGAGKQQPDIFEQALVRLGTDQLHTAVFEDSPHAMRTAHHAGFRVIAIYDESAYEEPDAAGAFALAEQLIRNYDECEVDSL